MIELSYSSLARRSCLGLDLARFPICLLRMALVVPDYTLMRVHQVIAWSFQVSIPALIIIFLGKAHFKLNKHISK